MPSSKHKRKSKKASSQAAAKNPDHEHEKVLREMEREVTNGGNVQGYEWKTVSEAREPMSLEEFIPTMRNIIQIFNSLVDLKNNSRMSVTKARKHIWDNVEGAKHFGTLHPRFFHKITNPSVTLSEERMKMIWFMVYLRSEKDKGKMTDEECQAAIAQFAKQIEGEESQ